MDCCDGIEVSPVERWSWRLVAAGLAAAAVLAALAGPAGFLAGTVTGSPATSRPAPCLPGTEVSIMDSPHVSPAELATVRYNSDPPTSGPHYGFTVTTGVFTDPVPVGLAVHAMEHGHVVVRYGPGTPEPVVARLRAVAKRYSRDVLLAPHPGLAAGIALTAWGRLDRLDGYDEARVTGFVERLRGRYVHGWTQASDC